MTICISNSFFYVFVSPKKIFYDYKLHNMYRKNSGGFFYSRQQNLDIPSKIYWSFPQRFWRKNSKQHIFSQLFVLSNFITNWVLHNDFDFFLSQRMPCLFLWVSKEHHNILEDFYLELHNLEKPKQNNFRIL